MTVGNDVELICTGNEMRWISVSLSMQANAFVFIESPPEAEQIDVDELCPDLNARDDDTPDLFSTVAWLSNWSAFVTVKFAVQQAKLLTHKFALSVPRGPPNLFS